MESIVETKRCPQCREVKELAEYHLHRNRKDGRAPQCKECKRIYDLRRAAETCAAQGRTPKQRIRREYHGLFGTRTYGKWRNMIQRCTNQSHPRWQHYGGRGILVCEQWRQSFTAFLDDMGEAPEGLSLDRINNDGNYEPGNCRWADARTQRRNQRPCPHRHHNRTNKVVSK